MSPAAHKAPEREARPFLKWAGGKRQLVPKLRKLAPARFGTYFEPFLGGGALFFALVGDGRIQKHKAVLSDINAELVKTYEAIRDDVEAVIARLHEHDRQFKMPAEGLDADYYYKVRASSPRLVATRAARMIFLNRTCFNGLYRVNARGQFNVPLGRYKNPTICDPDNLKAVARALEKAQLREQGYESVLERAARGDLVYFDPPYVPVSATAKFVSYGKDGFDMQDQERLAGVFRALAEKGVQVMLSNSDTPAVRRMYRGFRLERVEARRSVNSRKDRRGPVGELVVMSWEG
ncbi:MAG: DNA adenine methylase [Deltaproteobacteria bacterium]|nr:DNA adenine methylase [Deltaproteobacteria bacterium]